MKKLLSKTLVGALFLTGICVSNLTTEHVSHNSDHGHTKISNEMQSQDLACCESHEKEAGLAFSSLIPNNEGKFRIGYSHQPQISEMTAKLSPFIRDNPPSAPPKHKLLASVIRLE